MRTRLGPLTAQLSEAERAKFTAPLVLVHGLWDAPASWRRCMGFFSHRGWRCIAVGWPEGDASATLTARAAALEQALAELGEPAVVVGHDLGGALAMRVATRAAVALAPLVPGMPAGLAGAGTWLQRLRAVERSPGRALAASYPGGAVTEPTALLTDIEAAATEAAPNAAASPRLVVAGAADPVAPPARVQAFATASGAELEVVPGPHALHLADGWEETAGLVHRWLIRSLGEDLLALYEEAWADRE